MKTVYIVGAGASFEAGLPTGDKLKSEIANILNISIDGGRLSSGDFEIFEALRQLARNENENVGSYIEECQHISRNMPLAISIDNFLDTERENSKLTMCGKLGIVKSILNAERNSKLYKNSRSARTIFDYSSLNDTWYLALFRALTENCNLSDLRARLNKVTIIIFNYDRCLEHFLINAIVSYYRIDTQQASEIISCIEIIHPYGSVGPLDWQSRSLSVNFGQEVSPKNLLDFSYGIRTFTEGANSNYIETLIHKMRHTERLVYLGFGFHRQNMNLLGGYSNESYDNPNTIMCYATAYNFSQSDQEVISDSLKQLYSNAFFVLVENLTCNNLFQNYSKSLGY